VEEPEKIIFFLLRVELCSLYRYALWYALVCIKKRAVRRAPAVGEAAMEVSSALGSSAVWMTPEGADHPQDVGAYAPLCAPAQSSIFQMAKHALLGNGVSTALIIGANAGRSGSDFVFDGLKTLSQTRKVFVEPMPTLHRQLTREVTDMPHARTVRAAVSDDSTRAHLSMFCLGKTLGGDESRFIIEASEAAREKARAAAHPSPNTATTPTQRHFVAHAYAGGEEARCYKRGQNSI